MKPEVEKLKIKSDRENNIFELELDGTQINGVKKYELKSSDCGEPELSLTLNIADFTVDIK